MRADTGDGDAGDHKGGEGGNLLGEVSLLRSGPSDLGDWSVL